MENHVDNYLAWLKENMTQTKLENGLIEVTTPFLDRNNDYTQIYLKKETDSTYIVTDLGYTVTELILSGVDLTTNRRKMIFNQILCRLGIQYDEREKALFIKCDKSKLPVAQHSLMQGMLDVNDMFYLANRTVKSLFYDDVCKFFDENDIFYSKDINIVGKSGLNHSFDFLLQRNKKNPERLIRLLNIPNRSNIERLLFAWQDVSAARNFATDTSKFIIIINDNKNVSETLLESIDNYAACPIKWSDRNDYLENFG